MRVVLRSAPRRPWIPTWVLGFLLLWILADAAVGLITHLSGHKPVLCLFRLATGEPCPVCGTTRGVQALLRGDVLAAWRWNPLTMTIGAAVAARETLRIATGRTLALEASPRVWRCITGLGLALLGLNWAWLVYSHP